MRRALLARGFFPRELPPPFSTETFGTAYGVSTPTVISNDTMQTNPVSHNLPRAGLMRRPLSIPDPIRYLKLTDEICGGWATFHSLFHQSNLSLTRPRRDHLGHRAFTFRVAFSRHDVFRARVRAGARYILRADINQFYPSTYTHAIPWALHTKPFAKANRGYAHLGNRIDRCIRDAQDGQTMGIPIGPDTSFLIAEVLLSSLDSRIIAAMGNKPGMRMMDEYEFAFDSYTEAEQGIAILQDLLSEVELSLNPRKTVILECPLPLNPEWLTTLHTVSLPQGGTPPRRPLVTFIDFAFNFAHQNKGDPVLNWAISRLLTFTFTSEQWSLVEPMVLQAAVSEPGALPRCLRLILQARLSGRTINTAQLKSALGKALLNAARRGHGSEASWAVWGHILFNLSVDAQEANALSQMDDDVVALVTLDARARGLLPSTTSFPRWTANLTTDGLRDGHWLLVYEAIAKGWLTPPGTNPILAVPPYGDLLSRQVAFYTVGSPESLTLANAYAAPAWQSPIQSYLT